MWNFILKIRSTFRLRIVFGQVDPDRQELDGLGLGRQRLALVNIQLNFLSDG